MQNDLLFIDRPLAYEALKELDGVDKRELRLLKNCVNYANDDPAGLPGHNLMIIINKLQNALLNPSAAYLAEAISEILYTYSLEFDEMPKEPNLYDFIEWLATDPMKKEEPKNVD